MIDEKQLQRLRDKYPSGTKIRLLKDIVDEFSNLYVGATGTVDFVDDAGNINMEWDNGSTLSLIDYSDSFEIISLPEKIKVIVAEPKKEPYVKEIYNTLRAKQELVGGLIECTPSFFDKEDSYDFMVCEEGKIYGFPLNRYIYDKQDIVAGNLVIIKADLSTGDFVTLTDEEINPLMDKLKDNCPMYEENQIEIEETEEIEK